jgi:hypothetical protein
MGTAPFHLDLQQQARIETLPPDTGKIVCIANEDCQRLNNSKETATPPLASAHAALPAPEFKCKSTTDYINGHEVITSKCSSVRDGQTVTDEEWYKDGKLDRADGPADFEREPDGTTRQHWYKDGKEIAPPGAAVAH